MTAPIKSGRVEFPVLPNGCGAYAHYEVLIEITAPAQEVWTEKWTVGE